MDLREFMADTVGEGKPVGFDSLDLRDFLGQQPLEAESKRCLLMTHFWRALTHTAVWSGLLNQAGVQPDDPTLTPIIVPRPEAGLYDLLVLGQSCPSTPYQAPARPKRDAIAEGWSRSLRVAGRDSLDEQYFGEILLRALVERPDQPFKVVFMAMPKLEQLSVPDPPQSTVVSNAVGTAGVWAQDKSGLTGVTAALHVVGGAQQVTIGNSRCNVLATDLVSDSCFVELKSQPTFSARPVPTLMQTTTPRQQNAWFCGAVSYTNGGITNTFINGWDIGVPHLVTGVQLRIYTTHDADQGDSGAALITDTHDLVGFAFQRTVLGQRPAFCSWIWANQAIAALGLAV